MSKLEGLNSPQAILVVGGGVSGITAAVEAAEVGYEVVLIEKNPYLGGRVVQTNQYFPKLCPPNCGLEINFRRIKTNPKIKVFTLAELESINGQEGDYTVTVKLTPSRVNSNCTACGKCAAVCPVERANDFNYNMDKTKAIYLSHAMAFPFKYVIDSRACQGQACAKCVSVCPYLAIDLNMAPRKLNLNVGAIILATGWQPYEAARLDNLGFGRYKNVITNVMLERLAANDGPTGGKIVRPSDGKEVKSVAFVQCAGSRDDNHLAYCSAVCCSASLKHVTYIKDQQPEAKILIFYIDVRSPGVMEDFYRKVQGYPNLALIKGKAGRIKEDPQSGDLLVEADDIQAGKKVKERVELVVLATGIVPMLPENPALANLTYDTYGFIAEGPQGIYAAGCARRPGDVATSVRDATGAALKAIQSIFRIKKR